MHSEPPTIRRLICHSDVLRRPGWTRAKIAKLLWPPVARYRNKYHGGWSRMRMFDWGDMVAAEASEEFQEHQRKERQQRST
jgi:hypothetical protein